MSITSNSKAKSFKISIYTFCYGLFCFFNVHFFMNEYSFIINGIEKCQVKLEGILRMNN